ncbi:DUF3043 domain-containing protein [Actinoallomurus purpureus]|uniref:DUF3043 domain-containing protein n=1 Tax=Actinoallomurus purpureus TaxID=478114 RepID=UPI002092EBCE|nr:DUF3043 domain-containing protein [Actinoallomurus purpureus]MCO6005666.1 DUF3043 domain-containing protein [Actinoallomurus purpureus]
MFRRRTDTATEEPSANPEVVKSGGKGRPTPKRSEAQKRNRQPITAPRTRKEAYQHARGRQARERQKAKEGMARGDDRYLPKRDQGPARRLARDFVDSRRTFGEYFMYLTLLILLLAMVTPVTIKTYVYQFGWPVMLVLIVGESIYLGRRVKKLAQERFPEDNVRGLGFYTATRSMQIRRFRMPQPRLKPGQKDQI